MALLGNAAVAMWWDVAPEAQSEFEDWHSHEHMPERLRIPGFLRGTRWTSPSGEGDYFVIYELAEYETLTSKHYLDRLNNPTPWSTKMMPQHRNMTRSQCRVLCSHGGGVAHTLLTFRFSPVPGQANRLRERLSRDVLPALAARAGLTGAHLLQTRTPTGQAATAEQKIRGGDAVADWILLAGGYDSKAVAALLDDELQEQTLARHGACHERIAGIYRLSFSLTNKDLPSTSARCDSQPPSIGRFVSQPATRRLPKAADGKKGARGSRSMQEPLSRAQLRVLGLLNRGLTNQEIAKELEIGVGTIRWHLNNIFGKLEVRNRTEAIVRARELGLV